MKNQTMKKETDYLLPFLTMVFLFLVIGFMTTANSQFQGPLKEAFLSGAGGHRNAMATLITFSWFLAYPLCGPPASRRVDRCGYKSTLLMGLVTMVAGLLLFFLSSLFTSNLKLGFAVFLLGSFTVGASATILQVVINPYLSACSIRVTQPIQRLAIGGTANSIGTAVAPYFVAGVVFGGAQMTEVSVSQITVPFLVMAAVMALVLFLLARIPLPDIENTRAADGEKLERGIWSFRHLTLGVIAIFFYVGAEVCVGANINMHALETGFAQPALLATIYWTCMLVGRAACSLLNRVPPRTQLVFTSSAALLLLAAAVVFDSLWALAFTGLFHSIMWGAIYTLSIRHLGKYTSAASGIFMTGVVGGAVFPLLQGVLADVFGGWRLTWIAVMACESYILFYALRGSRVREADIESE
ncbi:MAG: MFS transporter [Bacteroidia bacterium]|nr:MFS transporter [Bacteroidia bacterium]